MMPASLLGFAHAFRLALAGADLVPLRTSLIERAARFPDEAATLLDLSTVLQLTMNREVGLDVQAQALKMQQLYRVQPAASPAGVRLLALMSPGDFMANTPLECLLEHANVGLDLLYVDRDLPFPAAVPDHDVLFVAVGENDRNRPLLQHLDERLRHWPRPVLNRPDRLLCLSRDRISARLQSAPGVVMPTTRRVDRANLTRMARGDEPLTRALEHGAFPILLRPAGSHAGQGLAKLESQAAINGYLDSRPEDEFFLTPFVDYGSPDGLFRKYRIAIVGGRPFLCHLAISSNWMIHYLNAGMTESADKRAEEARAMASFDRDFADRHRAALDGIHERMGLDYLVMDCGEMPDGRLLLFEADNCMVVHDMDPPDVFPYKPPQMRKVLNAFYAMLLAKRHGLHSSPPRANGAHRAPANRTERAGEARASGVSRGSGRSPD